MGRLAQTLGFTNTGRAANMPLNTNESITLLSFFPQWAQDINTGLGLIGFAITFYVLMEVRSIKRSFLTRARLPELIKDLERAGSTLNSNLDNWPSKKNEARSQVKIAATLLHSSSLLVPKFERKAALTLQAKFIRAAQTFDEPKFDLPEPVWDLYSDMQSMITSLKQISKNLKWE